MQRDEGALATEVWISNQRIKREPLLCNGNLSSAQFGVITCVSQCGLYRDLFELRDISDKGRRVVLIPHGLSTDSSLTKNPVRSLTIYADFRMNHDFRAAVPVSPGFKLA